jgi:hypothetical protein
MIPDRRLAEVPPSVTRLVHVFGLLGAATLVAGAALAPARTWANVLLVSYLLLGMGLAATVFIAFTYVTGSGWSVALRRVPEAMTSLLPFGAAGLAVVMLFHRSLFPWIGEHEQLTGFRHVWLDYRFFLARAAVYVGTWLLFTRLIVRNSRLQDSDGDPARTVRNARISAGFLVAFAVTFSLASFDWIMSLTPEWSSAIFGMYNFAGMFSGGLAAIILLVLWMERLGPLQGVLNEEHLHDLGKMLFAFTTFWMYIWFSQYMLIWYAHIPEETAYFVPRLHGNWEPLFLLNLFLNWVVPFLALLNRSAKRSRSLLAKIALVVLAGRWLDLYLMILPSVTSHSPAFGAWEIGPVLGGIALFLAVFFRASRTAAPVPLRDPYLVESLHYHH